MDQSFRLLHWLSVTLFLRKTSQESINLERKSCLDCSSVTLCTREEFGRVTCQSQILRSWRRWTHRKSTQLAILDQVLVCEFSFCVLRKTNLHGSQRMAPDGGPLRMGASSSRPSTTSREVAFRSTEKKQHGFPQLKASGEGRQRQPENVDPTPTQLCRRPAGVWPVWKRSRGGRSEERVVEGAASSPNTSIEGTASTEPSSVRRSELHLWSGNAPKNRRCWTRQERLKQEVAAAEPVPAEVPMQESSTEDFAPQGEGGPVGSGTNPASSKRVRRRRRVCGRPRRSRHGISQFVDVTDFQRRLCF